MEPRVAPILAAVFALACSAAPALAQSTIYKCAGGSSVLYTTTPCQGAALGVIETSPETPRETARVPAAQVILAQATAEDVPAARSGGRDRASLDATVEARARHFREVDDARQSQDPASTRSSVAWARSALNPWPPREPQTPARTPNGGEAQWMAAGSGTRVIR